MKFHNQKSFMGHKISNVTNKPLLHKKGKQWIVVAVSALILAGFGGMVSTTTHADTTQPAATKVAQPSQNNGNSSKVASTSNPTNNNPSVTPSNNKPVHMLGGSNLTAQPTYQATSHGTWGTATWSIDNNGNLTISNGNLQGVNYFNGIKKNGKAYMFPQTSDKNKQTGYLDEDAVKTINVQNVIAPKNASGLFSGDEGQWQNTGTYNHFNNVQSIDLSGLDTSNTTDMSSMFHGDNNLSTINLNHMNTSQVTNMQAMFDDDHNIKSLNLNSFDTSKCNTFDMMFYDMPNLQLLDIHNFVVNPSKSGFNVGGMFEMNGSYGSNHLKELVVGPNFKLTSDYTGGSGYFDQGQPNNSGLNNSAIDNNMSWYNSNSHVTVSNLSDIVNHTNNDGVWIAEPNGQTSSMTDYTVNFLDQSNSEKNVGQTKFEGMQNALTLPINGISLPNGYRLAPNAGTTANVTNSNTANIDVLPNDASAYGTWGSSNWILYNDGELQLTTGELKSNDISTAATNNLQGLEDKVTSISTKNNTVTAPADSSNLFIDFPNATSVDLSGLDESGITNNSNMQNMLSNFVRTITLGTKSKLYAPNELLAYNNQDNNQDVNIADGNTNHQGTWIIDYAGTMSAEASADAQSAKNAANTSASNTFTSASNWVHSNSNSAQSADSWVAKNSQSESNASTEAENANTWVSNNSASESSASASANANSNWIKDHSGSLASAYNSATSAMNSLNADSSELNWLNSSEESISSDDSWVETHSADLNNLNRNWQSVNTRISTDEGNLNKVINTKADSSTLTSDVDTLNKDIRTASGIAAQAKQLANTNAANISNNSANASNSAYNAQTNAENYTSAYINSLNATASASASSAYSNASNYANQLSQKASTSISNSVSSLDSHINSSYSSAIASAQNMASGAKTSAESSASSSASSAYSNASSYANTLSKNASTSINTVINSVNTSIANASASASSSVASLSDSTNTASSSASKGISNANASASASASVANSEAQSLANQNSLSASISAANANSNADSYALSLANNATGVANSNAGGIDNTMSYDDQTVQSLSNTVNANTISLANNDNDLYQSKENKPAAKKHGVKIAQLHQPLFYFYALKPLWLHTSAKFTKGNRAEELSAKHGYTLPITRIFKVNGALRFEVKIDGAKYFVTGNRYFARNAYIQPNEVKHNSSVKVLKAIREYKRAGFGKKNFIKGIRKGTVLPIKRAKTVANKQVTRLQLTNGHWITANKNLVKLI